MYRVTAHDGTRWEDAESFDRVLVDAPCSSDRHVLQQAAARGTGGVSRADWSLQRCRRIATQQVKLLAAAARVSGWARAGVEGDAENKAFGDMTCNGCLLSAPWLPPRPLAQALRPGGCLVYSTCSILDLENDQVVERVLKRAAGSLRVVAPAAAALEAAGAERTRHGWLLLPDTALSGPIYLTVLEKTGSSSLRRIKQNKYQHLSKVAL